jgi:transcriptional regulator with XRE-family HTH domain
MRNSLAKRQSMSTIKCKSFPEKETSGVINRNAMTQRALRADLLLAKNIKALLAKRNIDQSALAAWCGHSSGWSTKVLSGERGIRIADLNRIADFFGLDVPDLFRPGIIPLTERRRAERRVTTDRRTGADRRDPERLYRMNPELDRRQRSRTQDRADDVA